MSDYAKPDVLVDVDWLEGHIGDDSVRLIEVDEDSAAYEKGHIEGAVGWNWTTDLHTKVGRDYVSQDELAGLLSAAGVGPATTVVLYGGNNNWFAAYAYWILKLRGFDNVKLLDGGRKKWELESLPLTQEVPTYAATGLTIDRADRPEIRALRDEVIAKIGQVGLVDVRSPEEYRGEKLAPDHLPQEQSQVPGHVPGAANIPWAKAANEDGTFKSADELRELYETEGITSHRELIAYCRIGERSSHTWFALQELLGYTNVKNYDGSWTEYGSLVGVPVELGAEELGKQGVVAVPAAVVVDGDHERVRALQVGEQLARVVNLQHRVAKRGCHRCQNRCCEQEAAALGRLPLKGHFAEVVGDLSLVSGDRLCDVVGGGRLGQRVQGEGDPGRPSLRSFA